MVRCGSVNLILWPKATCDAYLANHADPGVRADLARRRVAGTATSVIELRQRAASGTRGERQDAPQALAVSADPAAIAALDECSGQWTRGERPQALALDLIEALAIRRPGYPVLAAWGSPRSGSHRS